MRSGTPGVKAAFLVDPVDNTRETPEGPDYPSAAKALQVAGRPVAMCGASVIGGCNPAGSNWQVLVCYHILETQYWMLLKGFCLTVSTSYGSSPDIQQTTCREIGQLVALLAFHVY